MTTPNDDFTVHAALLECLESKLKQAHHTGKRITDAEADAIWECSEVQNHLRKAGLNNAEFRRLYDHVVARANTDGGNMQPPQFPEAMRNYATHDAAAQSHIHDAKRAALADGKITDPERRALSQAYANELALLNVPPEARKALTAFREEMIDYQNASASYQASEICQYGPKPVRKAVQLAAGRVASDH